MREPIECWMCGQPGRLDFETYPARMVHFRRACELPPRDLIQPGWRGPSLRSARSAGWKMAS